MKNTILLKLSVSILFMNILLSNSILTNDFMVISSQTQSNNEFIDEIYTFESPKSLSDPPFVSENLSNYTLSVKLHEEEAIVEGNLTVDYYNDDLVPFNQIPFHIYPSGMVGDLRYGFMDIIEVKTIGGSQTSLDFLMISSEQLMWINLTETLIPNERVSFFIQFITTLPDGGIDRSNYHGTDLGQSKIFKFAVAYPMAAVYDEKDGWNIDPYLGVGDPFYSDMAWYDFFVEVPTEFVVAATGKLIKTTMKSDTIEYHYNPLLPVRELTFSASRYFICESILVNNVNISTYFLPKSQEFWEDFALSIAVQALTLNNDTFGPYPYPTFNVVEEYTHYGGMEHPLQVYITESTYLQKNPLYYLELVIVHETAHQWFYHLIGNDQIDAGFLDEGLVVWSTDFYFDHYYPERNLFDNYYLQYEIRHYHTLLEGRPNNINISLYDCDISGNDRAKPDYWYIAYSKAPMIFQKLRVLLGNEYFLSGIRLFFDRFEFKIAWLSDLQDIFEEICGKSLGWFFQPWFNNRLLPKYNFSSKIYDVNSSVLNITIKDLNENSNEYPYSQQMTLVIYDNQTNILFNNEIWINGTTLLSLSLTSTPDKMKLIFTDNVLAQSFEGKEYVEGYLFGGGNDEPDPKISGMPYIAIFISLPIGIIITLMQMNSKKKC